MRSKAHYDNPETRLTSIRIPPRVLEQAKTMGDFCGWSRQKALLWAIEEGLKQFDKHPAVEMVRQLEAERKR
jgi:hypothetical protein